MEHRSLGLRRRGAASAIDPVVTAEGGAKGRAHVHTDPIATANAWREQAAAHGWSIRELVISFAAKHTFVGTPTFVAETINRHVQEDASDGFVIVGNTNPTGLDEFVDLVIPELQERGVYRTDYDENATLHETLGLPTVRDRSSASPLVSA